MFKYFAITLILAIGSQAQDIDQLIIQQIFGLPNNTTPNGQDQGGPISDNFGPTSFRPTTASESLNLSPAAPNTNSPDTEPAPCETPDGHKGFCVAYYLCNVTSNSIINDGDGGILDIRIQDGPCASYLTTCCQPPNTRPPTDPITPKPEVLQRSGCGWRNENGLGYRITGNTGGESEFGEFPWMAALLTVEPINENEPDGQKLNVYVGGGSIISRNAVLTAAHYVAKVWKNKEIRVRAGEWDTQTTNELYPYQDRKVSDVAIHKDFNKGNLFYDIAILFLETPLDLAPNVQPVCLPTRTDDVPRGTQCFASGWGKDQFEKAGKYQVILKKVQVPIVDRRTCQDQLRKTRLGAFFELHSSFICAGGEVGKDTCKGDGGSPLVCPSEDDPQRYVQNGIVAWGIGCGKDGVPGVYVNVGNLKDWIANELSAKGIEYPDVNKLI